MDELDRLGWAAGFVFHGYGLRLGVRTNDPDLLERLARILPPGVRLAGAPDVDGLFSLRVAPRSQSRHVRPFHLAYSGIVQISRGLVLDEVLETLESNLRVTVAAQARRRVFIHAGVVGWKGQAIVIPGRSYAGKSTLVRALVRAGASYYSDEYAVLDAQGRVHPFAKPLSLRVEGETRSRSVPVEEIGGRAGRGPLPVGLVLVTRYRAGAKWRPRTLSPGQSALALLDNAVPARLAPARVLEAVQHAAAGALGWNADRGEADEVAAAILSRFPLLSPAPVRVSGWARSTVMVDSPVRRPSR